MKRYNKIKNLDYNEILIKTGRTVFALFCCGLSIYSCIILKDAFLRDSLTFTIVNAITCFTFFSTFLVLDSIKGFIGVLLRVLTVILSVLGLLYF